MVCVAIAIAAPNLAAGNTPRRASTSLYKLSLKISGSRFVGDGAENTIAVDRHGNAYTFTATRTQQGSIPSADAPDVEELSPTGKKIRSFSTTFRVHGQRLYMQVNGLAVTPGGKDVFVVGNYSKSLKGLVDSKPFLAKYSASTGAFLKGYQFDSDETRLGSGVAVDPTGQHVYVGDERNPFVGRTTARIYEFDVSGLHEVRQFRLAGNDVCCDLAVSPDGHVFADVGPPHSTQVLIQEYSATGVFENQFISPPEGLAIGPTGDIFAGSRTKRRIDRLSRSGKLLETLGSGHFTGFPVAEAVDSAGDVYAFDVAKNDVSTILKFAPVVPQTTITAHPRSTLQIPTATFRFKSSHSRSEARVPTAQGRRQSAGVQVLLQPDDLQRPAERELHVRGEVDLTSRPRRSHPGQVQVQGPARVSPDDDHLQPGRHDRSDERDVRLQELEHGCEVRLPPRPDRVPATGIQGVSEPSHLRTVERRDLEVRGAVDVNARRDRPDAGHLPVQDRHDTAGRRRASRPDDPGGRTATARRNARRPGELVGERHLQSCARICSLRSSSAAARPPRTSGHSPPIPTLTDMQGTTSAIVPIAPGGPYHQLRVRAQNQLGVAAESSRR